MLNEQSSGFTKLTPPPQKNFTKSETVQTYTLMAFLLFSATHSHHMLTILLCLPNIITSTRLNKMRCFYLSVWLWKRWIKINRDKSGAITFICGILLLQEYNAPGSLRLSIFTYTFTLRMSVNVNTQ